MSEDVKLATASGKLSHTETSPTAASRYDRKFLDSGAMDYRVTIGSGGGMRQVVVNAKTGDEAADGALAQNMGWKVLKVDPASSPAL